MGHNKESLIDSKQKHYPVMCGSFASLTHVYLKGEKSGNVPFLKLYLSSYLCFNFL